MSDISMRMELLNANIDNKELKALLQERDATIAELRAQVGSKWISVEDKLPDGFGDFLVFGTGFLETDYFSSSISEFAYRDDATHWMPLPKPPELLESEK